MQTTLITGNTYPVREQLKALGGRWDANRKGWNVPAEKAEIACRIVNGSVKYTDDKWGQIDRAFDRMTETRRMKYLSCL